MKKKINVLSLFDGMSCGRIALERSGIDVKTYYASEIDKYSIQVSEDNYPDIVRLGDVIKWREWTIDWASIDLLIGGSPCQGFSFAGKQLAFNDPRSVLFFEYVAILNHIKEVNPKVKFLLENVKMKKEYMNVISQMLQVKPMFINSSLLSAQNRQRYYWFNWFVSEPKDKGIILKDILDSGEVDRDKSLCLTSRYDSITGSQPYMRKRYFNKSIGQIVQINPSKESGGKQPFQQNRVYSTDGKFPALVSEYRGNITREGNKILVKEATKKGYATIKPGELFDLEHIKSKTRRGRRMKDKSHCLMAKETTFYVNECDSVKKAKYQCVNGIHYRKLTPIECERLQTVPDNYTKCVSNSQRYKMLGNGWTVDVIAHILRGLINKEVDNELKLDL